MLSMTVFEVSVILVGIEIKGKIKCEVRVSKKPPTSQLVSKSKRFILKSPKNTSLFPSLSTVSKIDERR